MPFARLPLALFAVLLLCLAGEGTAQEVRGKVLLQPSLVADTTAIAPGKPFTVGVLMKMAPGWHTYWQFSGDSGAAPKIDWQLPEGFRAGEIQWPLPHARMDPGDLLTYVYEDEVMLLVEITPPAQLPAESVQLKASLRWLVCEKTCIPGKGDVELTLPTTGPPAAANAELFTKYRAQLPKATGAPFQVAWERSAEAVKLQVSGLPQEFKAEFFPLPPNSEVRPDHPKITDPAADGSRTVTVPITEGGAPNLPWQGLLVTSRGDAPREGWLVSSEGSSASPAAQSPRPVKSISIAGLMAVIWGAFLGGLILNLMPCVLPVIALKIFGFVQQAGEEPRRIFRLGLAFVAGVFTFFLAIAVVVIALNAAGRSFNWGFQFQNPYLLISLLVLVFVFALSMFGLFEVTLGGGAATKLDQLAHKGGYGGAFMHGLFTTLLGTSCTAPFLGPVLGFAVAQSPPVVLTIFLAIAAGMSLPYFLLTWRPAWMRYLPKPGVWMERVKQFMGFALLGVVVWLLGVYGESRGVTSLVSVICFLLALGLACWIFGAFRRSPLAYVAIVAVIAGAWWGFLAPKKQSAIAWQPFTPERVAAAVQSGQPVFIDFTADWCLNCKYNEKFVIDTEPVRAAIRDKNLLMLQADWTDSDPVITEWLNKFGRVGVPLYVLYVPGSEEPVVMPELLTQNLLLKHFSAIPKEPPAASRLSRAP